VGYHPPVTGQDLATAFSELHGPRLYGFALLTTLGDRDLAGRLAAEALSAGIRHVEKLRHPERGAAWLRAAVVRGARRPVWGQRRPLIAERRHALAAIGLGTAAFDALATLDVTARAAIAASVVEGMTAADVSEIAGSGARARRARGEFVEAYAAAVAARNQAPPQGTLHHRLAAVAGTLGTRSG
jgi:DNA-directed RNA polymerase specialized sigma24 family protein